MSAWILASIVAIEGLWVVLNFARNPVGFMRYIGFAPGRAGAIEDGCLRALSPGRSFGIALAFQASAQISFVLHF